MRGPGIVLQGPKNVFSAHAWTGVIVKAHATGNQENEILTDPVRCPKSPRWEPSRLKSNRRTITLQEPCLQGILLSDSLSLCFGCKALGLVWVAVADKQFFGL